MGGKCIGYARGSTTDQDTAIQEAALTKYGCAVVLAEKRSGTTRQGREKLALALELVGDGDTLVVTRIDRLARSVRDLQDIAAKLKAKGVNLRATEQSVDTSTAAGKAFFDMLGVFAEFETSLRLERQAEGIAKAKAEGVYKGRPRKLPAERVAELAAQSVGATEIAKRLGMSRASVYRLLRDNAAAAGAKVAA